jgi:hypothetical protein
VTLRDALQQRVLVDRLIVAVYQNAPDRLPDLDAAIEEFDTRLCEPLRHTTSAHDSELLDALGLRR